jgi:hypothetical protein
VQLADDDALGAVDDELAAAQHDRHVAEVDFFLDRLLFDEAQPDAERTTVGQPQLPALGCGIARLAQLVPDVLEPVLPVVAFDGENFAENLFETLVGAAVGPFIQLQESRVRLGLNLGEIRELEIALNMSERPDLLELERTLRGNRHASPCFTHTWQRLPTRRCWNLAGPSRAAAAGDTSARPRTETGTAVSLPPILAVCQKKHAVADRSSPTAPGRRRLIHRAPQFVRTGDQRAHHLRRQLCP